MTNDADQDVTTHLQLLAQQARDVFAYLYKHDEGYWSYNKIRSILNEATGRDMDVSFARRFVIDDAKGPKFSPSEIVKIHRKARELKAEFNREVFGITTPLILEFTPAVLHIQIPLAPDQHILVKNDPALQDFISKTVLNAIALLGSVQLPREPT